MAFFDVDATTTDDRKKELKIIKKLRSIDRSFTMAGIFRDAGTYPGRPWPVAQIGFWQEFGTRTIPSRPWMRSTIDTNIKRIDKLTKQLEFELLTRNTSVKDALDELGLNLQIMLQKRIQTAQRWAVPLAPSTIASKLKGGGVRGPVPLIRTAKMLRSIQFRSVVKKI